MLGSILSNLLLVMGMCFLFGGIKNMTDSTTGEGMEQEFATVTAQTTCSLMTLSSASMIIPATVRYPSPSSCCFFDGYVITNLVCFLAVCDYR
jgi:calcium/proton exchanger cax